jgi:hypothetical protein
MLLYIADKRKRKVRTGRRILMENLFGRLVRKLCSGLHIVPFIQICDVGDLSRDVARMMRENPEFEINRVV